MWAICTVAVVTNCECVYKNLNVQWDEKVSTALPSLAIPHRRLKTVRIYPCVCVCVCESRGALKRKNGERSLLKEPGWCVETQDRQHGGEESPPGEVEYILLSM